MTQQEPNRRHFLQSAGVLTAGAAAVASGLGVGRSAHAAEDNTLKLALVGCGGRGRGAIVNALRADENTKLVAVADAFKENAVNALTPLRDAFGDRIDVPEDRIFDGLEGYKGAIDCCDVALLCETPHFRPLSFGHAVAKGKQVFCEKPVAVDAPGVRSVLESARIAKEKKLNVVAGLCWRYDYNVREVMKRVMDGEIGDILTVRETYLTAPVWTRKAKPGDTEMMAQVRNWYNFHWLSGDFNTEQHIHSLDKGLWAFGDKPPVSAFGIGGRMSKVEQPAWGDVYDAMAVVYEYSDGRAIYAFARQQPNCWNDVDDYITGTKGNAIVLRGQINGKAIPKVASDMYQNEHNELFAAIRSGGKIYINDGVGMAQSTMLAILGREVCYTGKRITWDEIMASNDSLSPSGYTWDATPPTLPDANGRYKVAVPGQGFIYHEVTR
ncbi:MAG: Gfo/Idh/MocA family protein [Thermoguttaceae bacterium]